MDWEKSPETYCVVCKIKTKNKNPTISRTSNKVSILKTTCAICNKKTNFYF